MLRIKRLFLIFICQFALSLSSSSGFNSHDALISTSSFEAHRDTVSSSGSCQRYLVQAAQVERDIYYSQNPIETNALFLQKAQLYEAAGEFGQALSTLDRVRLYLLNATQRYDHFYYKAWIAYQAGEYDTAISCVNDYALLCVSNNTRTNNEISYNEPSLKNQWMAMGLTFLVPAGFAYVEAPVKDALIYTGLTAASVAWIVLQLSSGCYISGIVGGALALNVSYLGAQNKVALLLSERNSKTLFDSKREFLKSFFQASSEGRIARPE